MYSGHVAGAVYARIEVPERCILLCPNHTGMGRPLAIMSYGSWETPLGRVAIDEELATSLKQKFSFLNEDSDAHRGEHAVEVQLPFLQERRQNLSFVPIALGTGQFDMLEALGVALAEVLQKMSHVLIIASSDMNHYENDHITRIKDHKALAPIRALDPRGLFDVVMKEEVSMCGFGPAVAMLTAARRLGAVHAEVVKYATSGDVSGDRNLVVGYAGVIVR
jgi:AmmeMemoRadiSam system protein B